MGTSSLHIKISGLLAGFALFASCLLSLATAADISEMRYPSVVVAVESGDLELDWNIMKQADTALWEDLKKLEGQALIWRVNFYKHSNGIRIGNFMDWVGISTRKINVKLPMEQLIRAEVDFCITQDPHDANAGCGGRQINILMHKYPD